jgi:urease accessory protein UreF
MAHPVVVVSAQEGSIRNLEELAEYLRDMLLERHGSADAAVLAEALESVQRELAKCCPSESQKRPAA